MLSVSLFRSEFNKFNNTGARLLHLDSIYYDIKTLLKNRIFGVKT